MPLEKGSELLNLYKVKTDEYNSKKSVLDKELREIIKILGKVREEMKLLKGTKNTKYQRKVFIQVAVKEPCKFDMALSYIVTNSSWTPTYSVRVNTNENKCTLSYQADIFNNTGEDWENVNITLSSHMPSLEGSPPKVSKLEVRTTEQRALPSGAYASNSLQVDMVKKKKSARKKKSKSKREVSYDDDDSGSIELFLQEVGASVQKSISNSVFNILRTCSISSDNKSHKVTITDIDLDVKFEYIAVPALTGNAYLKAIAINNSEYTLLPGKMNTFMDDIFVATSSIKQTSPKEELELYLGTDLNIKIEALPNTQQSSKTGWWSKNKRENENKSCFITNNKSDTIFLTLFEQLPKTSDDRIEISMESRPIEIETITTEQGLVRWDLNLPPGETIKIEFSYTIEYPDGKELTIRKEFLD